MRKPLVAFLFLALFSCAAFAQSSSQTIALKNGFNFVAFTVKPAIGAAGFVGSDPAIEEIYSYNSAAGTFISTAEGLSSISPGKGYIVKTKADKAVSVSGTAVAALGNISLKTGFNLIGVSRSYSAVQKFSDLMRSASAVRGLYKWNASSGAFIAVVRNAGGTPDPVDGFDPAFAAGQAYFIDVASDTTINYDGGTITIGSQAPAGPVYADVHAHLQGYVSPGVFSYDDAASSAVSLMDARGVKKILLMAPPFTNQASQDGARYECTDMASVLTKYPDRFAFLGGGRDINMLIQIAVSGQRAVGVDEFKAKAEAVAAYQGFAGFGELSCLHFSMAATHVFEQAKPDHELFLALVDVASQKGVPIDIHMEAVTENMPFPNIDTGGSTANPATLEANISRFENLLSYAKGKNVKIVWDHLGWDHTGCRTVSLCDRLLGTYDNLYMSIKHSPNDSPADTQVMDSTKKVKGEWLALFQKYPTRFMIGSDQFFSAATASKTLLPSFNDSWDLMASLPDDLRSKIGSENAKAVFNLK